MNTEKTYTTFSGKKVLLKFQNINEADQIMMAGIVLGLIRAGWNLDEAIQTALETFNLLNDQQKTLSGNYT